MIERGIRWALQGAAVALLLAAFGHFAAIRHDRLLVLEFPGLAIGALRDAAESPEAASVGAWLDRAAMVDLRPARTSIPGDFWREILGGATDTTSSTGCPAAIEPAGRIVGLPRRPDDQHCKGAPMLPGPGMADGFLGPSVGRVAGLDDARAGQLPWPWGAFDRSTIRVLDALVEGRWSAWLPHLVEGQTVHFRAYRLDRAQIFLTPLYRGLDPSVGYVADDPSPFSVGESLADVVWEHARQVTATRFEAAREAAASGAPVIVYHDTLAQTANSIATLVEAADAADVKGRTLRRMAASELVHRTDSILQAMEGAVAVVIVGRETGSDSSDIGYVLISNGNGGRTGLKGRAIDVPAILLHLQGVPDTGALGGSVPGVLRSRFRARASTWDGPPRREAAQTGLQVLDRDSLEPFLGTASAGSDPS